MTKAAGLTIQQALLTGKPFKREHERVWNFEGIRGEVWVVNEDEERGFTVDDLKAEDWEVKG